MGIIKGLICQAAFTFPFAAPLHCMEGAVTEGIKINTQNPGLVMESDFYIPDELYYSLEIGFDDPKVNWNNKEKSYQALEKLSNLVGKTGVNPYCTGDTDYASIPQEIREQLGKPFPMRIEITKDGKTIFDKSINRLCSSSLGYRNLLKIKLKKGDYHMRAYTLTSTPEFSSYNATLKLSGPNYK